MHSDEIIARIGDHDIAAQSANAKRATLTMLGLATVARETWPSAAYIEFGVTDQDHSGSLLTEAVRNANHQELSTIEDTDTYDEISWYLDDSNKSIWLPYMTYDDTPDAYRSEYVLDIEKVLTELSLD